MLQTTTFTIGDFAWHSWSNAYKLELTLTENSIDIGTNKSNVSGILRILSGSNNRFYDNIQCDIKLAGRSVASVLADVDIDYNSSQVLATFTADIAHNSDGTLSMAVWAQIYDKEGSNQYAPPRMTIEETWALTAIPRQATLLSAQDFSDTENPSVTYENPAGNAADSLQACISVDGIAMAAYRDVEKKGSSYTFLLTEGEREALRYTAAGNPPERTVAFYLKTSLSGTEYYSTINKTFRVKESSATKPSVDSITVVPVNSGLPSAFDGLFIQRKSRAQIAVAASGKYGASIQDVTVNAGGKAHSGFSAVTDTLLQTGSNAVSAFVTDSRGFTAAGSTSFQVVSYTPPSVTNAPGAASVLCYRGTEIGPDSNSTSIYIKAARKYTAFAEDGVQKNFCGLEYRVKASGESWNDIPWTTLIARGSTSTDVFEGLISGYYDNKTAYSVQLSASDDMGERHVLTFDIATAMTDLHLGGNCIGLGRYADRSRPKSVSLAADWMLYIGDRSLAEMLLDAAHPIGSYLQTDSGRNPGDTIGGVWELQTGDGYLWLRIE